VSGYTGARPNLAWALGLTADKTRLRVAIVGGGISALTVSAGLFASIPNLELHLFEKRSELCPLQQGCDSRWLHPRIYDWPVPGARAPNASLPLLNWSEGRAADVARQIVRSFSSGIQQTSADITVHARVEHLVINPKKRQVEWIGRRTSGFSEYSARSRAVGGTMVFDVIVIAAGFGVEEGQGKWEANSYWRNEAIAQPALDGMVHTFCISGSGDGALVDLGRLALERFRQDKVLTELFGSDLHTVESSLASALSDAMPRGALLTATQWFDLFSDLERSHLAGKVDLIRERVRKDTRVVLHLAGREQKNSWMADAFRSNASFMNRMLLYLLFRAGAFVPSFSSLEETVQRHSVLSDRVICRHGTLVEAHRARRRPNSSRTHHTAPLKPAAIGFSSV